MVWYSLDTQQGNTAKGTNMRDWTLTAEPGSLRRDAEHIVELDQITDHAILEDEDREKFDGAETIIDIWLGHLDGDYSPIKREETGLAVAAFADIAMEAGDGYVIDVLRDRFIIIADNQDEYDDALQSLASNLCSTDTGGAHARESIRSVAEL